MSDAPATASRAWYLLAFLAAYLALRFLWRAVVPGGAWPLPPEHLIEMGLDALALLVLVALRVRVAQAGAPSPALANVALAAGAVGGAGLLAIRFTSEAAWWTGHFANAYPGS
jgi:hypothetical protein